MQKVVCTVGTQLQIESAQECSIVLRVAVLCYCSRHVRRLTCPKQCFSLAFSHLFQCSVQHSLVHGSLLYTCSCSFHATMVVRAPDSELLGRIPPYKYLPCLFERPTLLSHSAKAAMKASYVSVESEPRWPDLFSRLSSAL